jgi:hypothetical protein
MMAYTVCVVTTRAPRTCIDSSSADGDHDKCPREIVPYIDIAEKIRHLLLLAQSEYHIPAIGSAANNS